jgi:hypothetical protein
MCVYIEKGGLCVSKIKSKAAVEGNYLLYQPPITYPPPHHYTIELTHLHLNRTI